ncbi:MAG: hypothetical protein IKB44_01880 [Clostridia bacterium]|nr:hypothetical protein [Clostridia bacterium]
MLKTFKYRGFIVTYEELSFDCQGYDYRLNIEAKGRCITSVSMRRRYTENLNLKQTVCEYIDNNYHYLCDKVNKLMLEHKNHIIESLIHTLSHNHNAEEIYSILKKQCRMTCKDIQELRPLSLVSYIDKKEYARLISGEMVFDGAECLTSSSKVLFTEDYFNGRFGIDIVNDTDIKYLIVTEILKSYSDNVISAIVRENEIVIEYEPWCCPNIRNDETFNITRNEPTLDM